MPAQDQVHMIIFKILAFLGWFSEVAFFFGFDWIEIFVSLFSTSPETSAAAEIRIQINFIATINVFLWEQKTRLTISPFQFQQFPNEFDFLFASPPTNLKRNKYF